MYAIVKTGGKQYRVTPGEILKIEKLNAEVGKKVELTNVLMVGDEKEAKIGNPTIASAKVIGEVLEQGRDKKIVIFKKKKRKYYRRKRGHRQAYTKLKILEIKAKA